MDNSITIESFNALDMNTRSFVLNDNGNFIGDIVREFTVEQLWTLNDFYVEYCLAHDDFPYEIRAFNDAESLLRYEKWLKLTT